MKFLDFLNEKVGFYRKCLYFAGDFFSPDTERVSFSPAGAYINRCCLLCIYMPAIDRSNDDCRYNPHAADSAEAIKQRAMSGGQVRCWWLLAALLLAACCSLIAACYLLLATAWCLVLGAWCWSARQQLATSSRCSLSQVIKETVDEGLSLEEWVKTFDQEAEELVAQVGLFLSPHHSPHWSLVMCF